MSRKNYIYNPKPFFNPSKNEKKRSAFICYAMKKASEIDVARSKLNYTLLPVDPKTGNVLIRFRRLNEHRACAMRAIVLAMLYYCDINSKLVEASIEKLADECGLSTFSESGNKSITRASRLISDFLEPMGFVKSKKTNNKIISNYASKKIFLTPMFFTLCNISEKKINYFLSKQKNVSQNIEDQKIFLSFSDIKLISKLDEKTARKKILNALINYYTASELTKIGPKGLKKKIDIEYSNLCKLYKQK
ncbi:plasmid replication initiator RepA [Buchnera aphidicola]|uniref:Replication-associated protein RepA2 n=1 Tax=Buchnera aphidicola str. Ua (Uroleucon ambrosiae) TaxID=1005057 RepID=G2LQ66_BUCUM|nr:plasmid replication initiator RepA [Buchnera aphidicola]AEO08367.1 replication-associated protein RepA2 [Buchnera aphidicola str. Ua (Uroleucon ambrosiae)]